MGDGMARSKFESSVGMAVNKTRYVMINVRLCLSFIEEVQFNLFSGSAVLYGKH